MELLLRASALPISFSFFGDFWNQNPRTAMHQVVTNFCAGILWGFFQLEGLNSVTWQQWQCYCVGKACWNKNFNLFTEGRKGGGVILWKPQFRQDKSVLRALRWDMYVNKVLLTTCFYLVELDQKKNPECDNCVNKQPFFHAWSVQRYMVFLRSSLLRPNS